MIRTLSDLEKKLGSQKKPSRLVLAAGNDIYALLAIREAQIKGFVEPIVVGDVESIQSLADSKGIDLNKIEILSEKNQILAVEKAVKIVSDGGAEILMKGASSTSVLLKAVLNKEWGLRRGALLSHISIFEVPLYHKLLSITDVAINIAPGLEEKKHIIKNAVDFLNSIGINKPKVALIAAVEKVYEAMSATVDAANIRDFFAHEKNCDCFIDGPFALDNAINKESADHKGIDSNVAGDADLLLMPQIESGNVLYKALAFLVKTKSAAVVLGAAAPIVLTSRADSHDSKLNSIMLAAASLIEE